MLRLPERLRVCCADWVRARRVTETPEREPCIIGRIAQVVSRLELQHLPEAVRTPCLSCLCRWRHQFERDCTELGGDTRGVVKPFSHELGPDGLSISRIGLGRAAVGRPAYITLGSSWISAQTAASRRCERGLMPYSTQRIGPACAMLTRPAPTAAPRNLSVQGCRRVALHLPK
jgi:hypothetical protein